MTRSSSEISLEENARAGGSTIESHRAFEGLTLILRIEEARTPPGSFYKVSIAQIPCNTNIPQNKEVTDQLHVNVDVDVLYEASANQILKELYKYTSKNSWKVKCKDNHLNFL